MKSDTVICFINEASSFTAEQMERILLEAKLRRIFPTRPKFGNLHWIHTKKTKNGLFDKYLKTK
jgi:hypothetical protein